MIMRVRTSLYASLLLAGAAAAQPLARPAPLPPKPVTETLFGTTVTDPYRYFETDDPAVLDWMKAEGRYTRAVLDSIPGRAALGKQVSAFTGSFALVQGVRVAGERTFYEERGAGADNFDLMVREGTAKPRKLIDAAALTREHGGTPYAINYYLPSPDGSKVAVGISAGGSEDASLTVYDVATGKRIGETLPRAQFGATGWTDDGKVLLLNQLADLPASAPKTERYQNSVALAWDLASPPVPLLSSTTPGPIKAPPAMFPVVATAHGGAAAFAMLINGTQNETELWTAPVAAGIAPDAPWTKLAGFDDDVTAYDASGDRIYLLSHKGAPTFQVLMLKAGQPLSAAKVIVPAQPGRLIENIGAAADGLYIRARRGLYSELTRVPLDGGPEEPIALPAKGSIGELFTDPLQPGATLILESWALPPSVFRYDPAAARFAKLDIGSTPPGFDPRAYAVSDLHATAKDGTQVPLSFVAKSGASLPGPLLLWAYGSYGISEFPYFSSRFALSLGSGIAVAVCHVRGGGELGEAWRLGGKDANKPNTWRDLIACAQELVDKGYTTPKQLFIMGGSAGGITMGRSMEERPDLFAGVFDMVPAANATRQEFSPNGVPNIPEFGTVKTEAGFHNLLAMDSVLGVKDGVDYPPIMITTGLNDPRVSPWEPAKLAARLMASGTKNPVLLRIDEQAGHGIGSTRSQNDALIADSIAFMKWRTGEAGWQPTVGAK